MLGADLRGRLISKRFDRDPPYSLWWESVIIWSVEKLFDIYEYPHWVITFHRLRKMEKQMLKSRKQNELILKELEKLGLDKED